MSEDNCPPITSPKVLTDDIVSEDNCPPVTSQKVLSDDSVSEDNCPPVTSQKVLSDDSVLDKNCRPVAQPEVLPNDRISDDCKFRSSADTLGSKPEFWGKSEKVQLKRNNPFRLIKLKIVVCVHTCILLCKINNLKHIVSVPQLYKFNILT